ncbi:MAG TPA: PIN domain-containing protein [Streptosporangiaceae bacterium]|nr:PIN domain-containing protein [Streptosporangiaceae bacterium]
MTIAVDTSVAIPLLVQSHRDHLAVSSWWAGEQLALSGHALPETYSVLTRLPGDARIAPADAVRLLKARFATPLALSPASARKIPETLSRLGLAGGAVYDALVALAAKEHKMPLASRDARARGTYDAVGVQVVVVV